MPLLQLVSRVAAIRTRARARCARRAARLAGGQRRRPEAAVPDAVCPAGRAWDASTYQARTGRGPGQPSTSPSARTTSRQRQRGAAGARLGCGHGSSRRTPTSTSPSGAPGLLDHGDGWRTYYVHLESVPPLTIGQQIAQGEQIGRPIEQRSVSMHLHYAQMDDGVPLQSLRRGTDRHACGQRGLVRTLGQRRRRSAHQPQLPGGRLRALQPERACAIRSSTSLAPADRRSSALTPTAPADDHVRGHLGAQVDAFIPFDLAGGQQHPSSTSLDRRR